MASIDMGAGDDTLSMMINGPAHPLLLERVLPSKMVEPVQIRLIGMNLSVLMVRA